MEAPEPRKIGPYRIEKVIGAGGMGKVYRAYDERLGRRVAVKQAREDHRPAAMGRRLRREASAAAVLAHPAIVQVFDILETADGDWIVMELVTGPTLSELLREGPLEVPLALAVARDVAEGLAYAHGEGILHRDLKCENVMLSPLGRAKILDFGLAKRLTKDRDANLSGDGAILGTCRSMSPEQAQGFQIDERSDLFSLGTLLYECFSGRSPFAATSDAVTLRRVCTFEQERLAKLVPGLPENLSNLVDRLLEKLPERRPSSAREVADELAELAGHLQGGGGLLPPSNPPALAVAPGIESETIGFAGVTALGEAVGEPESGTPARAQWMDSAALRSPRPPRAGRLRLGGLVAILALTVAATLVPRLHESVSEPASGRDPQALCEEGFSLLERHDRPGQVDRAVAAFEKALALAPDFAPAHAGLGRAYWRKYFSENRDPLWLDRALVASRRAAVLDGDLASAHISRGHALYELGRYDEALEAFGRALVCDPASAAAHRGRADVDLARGKAREAEAGYRRSVELAPDDWELHSQLGVLYGEQQRFDEAEEAFLRVVELVPDSYLGYRNLAGLYLNQGRLEEAVEPIEKALAIQPAASVYSTLGNLFYRQGRFPEAIAAFEKAVESGANNYLHWANLADLYRRSPGREQDARSTYLRAIRLLREELADGAESGKLRSRLALFLARRGEPGKAEIEAGRAAELAGEDPAVWFRCALAYELVGRRETALECLERALALRYPLQAVQKEADLIHLRQDLRYHRLVMGLEDEAYHDGESQKESEDGKRFRRLPPR